MVGTTGSGLSVLILAEPGQNWQAFATWYSFYKNLPEAHVAVVVLRNGNTPFEFFQWAKRLKVPMVCRNPLSDDPVLNKLDALKHSGLQGSVLIVSPLVAAIDSFDKKTVSVLNKEDEIFENHVWYLQNPNPTALLDAVGLGEKLISNKDDRLCVEAKETESLMSIVSYEKGCGRWINTAKGCPFSSAGGLTCSGMTANETRVNNLWRQMAALYNAVR